MRIASRGPVDERLHDGRDRGVDLGEGNDAIDESPRERLLRVEALGQQHDLHRAAHADEAGQRPGAAAVRR